MNRSWGGFNRAPYDEGLRTLKTAIQSIFGKIFPEAEERTKFRFPEFLMFDTFLKVGFFTFLIPFRISKTKERQFQVTTNIIQQVISTILVLGVSIHSLFGIKLLFTMDMKKNPSNAFAVIYGMFRHCFPIAWFYTFWFKRSAFSHFLLTCQASCPTPSMYLARIVSTSTPFMSPTGSSYDVDNERFNPRPRNSVGWKLAIVCRLAIIGASTKLILEAWNRCVTWEGHKEDFIWKILGYHAGAGLYNYRIEESFLERNKTNVTEWIEDHAFLNLTIMSTSLLLEVIFDAICNMVEAFCLIGAAVIFSICSRFEHEIPKIKGAKDDTITNPLFLEEQGNLIKVLERMSQGFMEMNNVEEAVNNIFGPVFLLYILGAFPSLAGFMVFKQRSSLTGEGYKWLSVIFSLAMHMLTAMIASEGSSKMTDYKCWLFDVSLLRTKKSGRKTLTGIPTDAPVASLSNAVLSRLNHLHREVASNAIGLKGCGFFTMTHGLIGTMLGIFVTFAIVIVQFEMETPKDKNN